MANAPATADTSINVTDGLAEHYVNGAVVDQIPELADTLPAPWNSSLQQDNDEEDAAATEPVEHVTFAGDDVADLVTLKAGGNLLVNEALVVNAGLTSSVIAVAGDVHQLDAIIQVNVFFDVDSVDAAFPGSQHNPLGTTTTYNVASFIQETLENTSDAAHQLGVMPANWQVSMVAGDVVFVEWLSQFIFSSDQDLSVLTSTGTTTLVTSGENVGLNSVKFVDIGLQYDLILIGGNLYDANVIVQTNILYDNDTIRSLSGEQDGSGTLNTSGNLLWNQASIHNVGPAQYQSEPITLKQPWMALTTATCACRPVLLRTACSRAPTCSRCFTLLETSTTSATSNRPTFPEMQILSPLSRPACWRTIHKRNGISAPVPMRWSTSRPSRISMAQATRAMRAARSIRMPF